MNGSPLAAGISDEVYERIRADTAVALAEFVAADGTLPAPLAGHVVTARPRRA